MMSSSARIDTPPAPALAASRRSRHRRRMAGRGGLPALRAELDRIDDAMHDLLMQRAGVVEQVGACRASAAAFRPGREASIIRRLLAPPSAAALPPQTLVRIWRELLAGTTAMQGRFSVAVCEPDPGAGFTQLAREHFGALTPLRVHRSPAQAMAEVSRGAASVAVLPLPSETETARDAWWTALLHNDEPRIHVVARLPFWAPRPEGAPPVQALVVAATPPDPSERDRSLLGLELRLRRQPRPADRGADRRRPDAGHGDPAARPGRAGRARAGRGRGLPGRRRPTAGGAGRASCAGRSCSAPTRSLKLEAPHERAPPASGDPRHLTRMSAGESTVPGVNRVLKLSSNEGAFGVPPGAQAAYRDGGRRSCTAIPTAAATELRRGDRRAVRAWIRRGSSAAPARTT